MKNLRILQARKSNLVAQSRAMLDAAAAEQRDLTADEQVKYDALVADLATVNASITREQALIDEERSIAALPGAAGRVEMGQDQRENDPRRGFASFGDFARAVHGASTGRAAADERLLIGAAAPTTYSNESSGAEGGYAVPPEYATEIFALSLGEDSLVPLTDNNEISGNSMVYPKDETTPWGTDGVRAYWQAEAGAATATKLKMGVSQQRMHKLIALVPITDELLADATALASYLLPKCGDSVRWKSNEAILWGTGAGQPAGAMNSGAVVSVPKDSAQTAATITVGNVAKMVARLPPGSFGRAVWLMNNDVLPSLFTLTLGNYPIYLPFPAGAQGSPYGTLLGRPVMVTQHAKTVGTAGDVMLADFKYYRTITKTGGPEVASSMHLYFDAAATAFRVIYRIDGQSKIAAAIAPANGSNNLSPFVICDVRA